MIGLSHPYQVDESTFIFRGIRSNILFFNEIPIAPDERPHSEASHLGLNCLPMSQIADAMLI